MKVIINGAGQGRRLLLSDYAINWLKDHNAPDNWFNSDGSLNDEVIPRHHKLLVEVCETFGWRVNRYDTKELRIKEIEGNQYAIITTSRACCTTEILITPDLKWIKSGHKNSVAKAIHS